VTWLHISKHSNCRNLVVATEVVVCPVTGFYAGARLLDSVTSCV
jgi:hypothetical protein